MNPAQFVEMALSGVGAVLMFILVRISNDLHGLRKSVEHLSENMAGAMVKIESHEKRLDKLEEKTP